MKTKIIKIFIPLVLLSTLCGCGLNNFRLKYSPQDYEEDGSLVTARAIPDVRTPETNMLGFLPQDTGTNLKILINRKAKSLSLMSPEGEILSTQTFDGMSQLDAGKYQVMHKQRNALWHAPDQYFQTRELATPQEGSHERFLRGALGEFVIFIDSDIPLHNGPIWTPQVGGLKIEDGALAKLYYSVEVGTPVEVF